MRKLISSKDVAREVGVTAATVSYVLNNTAGVTISKETTAKVLAAAEKLGYVPNQAAKTLGTCRTKGNSSSKLIGVVIPQTEPGKSFMFSNPFYGDFLSALEFEARKGGYHLLVSGVNVDQRYIEIAKNRALDGIVILGMYPSDDIAEYKNSGIPAVLVDCYCNSDHFFHSVRTDDRYGGYMATKYLIEKGHRQIAFVSGKIKADGVMSMRFMGYKDAFEEAGIPFDKRQVFDGFVDFQYGIEVSSNIAALNKRRSKDEKVTAIFTAADIIGAGLVKGLLNCGLSVPDDISVIGFDDIYTDEICNPSLTTIRQNIMEKGRTAAMIIMAAAKDPNYPKNERIIPIELVERMSVKELKH